jgi:hypothetical protein
MNGPSRAGAYHLAVGDGAGVDCCRECYAKVDSAVHYLIGRAVHATWDRAYLQARWLLAEKDALIRELTEAIDWFESQEDARCINPT